MSTDDSLPMADEYAAEVGRWLADTDLSGLPEPTEPVDVPPADAPVTVVRPVRLPYELDALVRALAEARGVPMSTLIREWISSGLTAAGQAPDPVTEIRRGLDTAQRALDALTIPPKAA
jgi:predicted DNA-binding protein